MSDIGQSWDKGIESVAGKFVQTCDLQTSPRLLGPDHHTYNYNGITGYFRNTHDVPDQLLSAYSEPQYRRQVIIIVVVV